MAFDFPSSPTVGQKYPSPSIVGVPTYTWDGEKWITSIGGPMGVVTTTVFTSTVSAWPVPAGISEIIIEAWGGGASGAGQASSAQRGAGGGGGAYGYKEYTGVMDSTLNIIVGAAVGGVAGVGGNNGNGTQISGTNLGTLTAGGGVAAGAAGFAASGGGGGAPSGPWTFSIVGGQGTTSGPTSTPSAGAYGMGGDSPRGGGGAKSNVGTGGNFPGGGGSGENHTGGGSGSGAGGQVIISTLAGVSGGPPFAGVSAITNSLGADVLLSNISNFFDGPIVAQGVTGIWFASGQVTCLDTAGIASIVGKLWDGTTVIDSALVTAPAANERVVLALSGYINNPVGNLRISVQDGTSTNGKIIFNASGLSKDSTLTAFRIG